MGNDDGIDKGNGMDNGSGDGHGHAHGYGPWAWPRVVRDRACHGIQIAIRIPHLDSGSGSGIWIQIWLRIPDNYLDP